MGTYSQKFKNRLARAAVVDGTLVDAAKYSIRRGYLYYYHIYRQKSSNKRADYDVFKYSNNIGGHRSTTIINYQIII